MEKTLRGMNLNDVAGFVYSLALVALALTGMTGVLYHAFAPNGSFGTWAAHLWASHPVFTTLVIMGLVAVALTARSQKISHKNASRRGDLPLYVFVALGTFFAARWVVSGAL